MDSVEAKQFIDGLRDQSEGAGRWGNPLHIATDTFRSGVVAKLSRDPQLDSDGSVALVELYLEAKLPDIDLFHGILEVDEQGIWYYDGDGDVDDPVWRQRLIPWRYIKTLIIHQTS